MLPKFTKSKYILLSFFLWPSIRCSSSPSLLLHTQIARTFLSLIAARYELHIRYMHVSFVVAEQWGAGGLFFLELVLALPLALQKSIITGGLCSALL